MSENLDIAVKRQRECELYYSRLKFRVAILSKLNWITVLFPSLLGIVAGSMFFSDAAFKNEAAALALVAAILTATHRGLNCDAYQIECRALMKKYRKLRNQYRTLSDVDQNDYDSKLIKLESKFAKLSNSDIYTNIEA